MFRRGWPLSALFLLLSFTPVSAETTPWSQLSLSTAGVDAFLKDHPAQNGSGIVIAVLDTGVDMDVPGLTKTSLDQMKVIDVQDFSTEGDVPITRALWDEKKEKIIHYAKDGAPEYFTPPMAADPSTFNDSTVWFGILDESMFKNSSVPDMNDNGRKNDEFALCVVSRNDGTDDDAICYVDTNLNRDFSDDKPLKNYKINYDRFTFYRERPERQTEPMTCAVNIFVKKRMVSVHFDDGGHGTHVAGIAAGYRIQGQDGFNGVAPGANVISLKLGHNSLAGGATTTGSKKAAFEYAARYARENHVTVVCNLSYGVGSMNEGHSDIDQFLDKLMRENPNLIVCTSAGNNGPGLSSIGSPAAATSPISVAALLAVDTAADVRAEKIESPQLTQFSSRGGELDKPDIATPGMETSTVPRWNKRGDFYQGTSMASPYAAGLCAILSQTLLDQGITPRADWIKQALKASGRPVSGFTALDYGAGIPELSNAARLLDKIAKSRLEDPLYGFEISTESPMAPSGAAPGAYWRGGYYPAGQDQVFTIKPIFVPAADATAIPGFSKRLMLKSDADWCTLEQDQIYFRSEQSAEVRVRYDASKLKHPGLYVATITGTDDGVPLLRLANSIVVPHTAGPEDGYRLNIENQEVEGWKVQRHFVRVPAGASAMHVKLKAIDGKPSTAQTYYLFRPDGRSIPPRYAVKLDTKNDKLESLFTVREELTPGVWEIPVTSERAAEVSHYSLEASFDGVTAPKCVKTSFGNTPTSKASGKITLTNQFDAPVHVDLSGQIIGCRKVEHKTLTSDDDTGTFTIKFSKQFGSARIKVKVSPEDYTKFTDCAINVYDGSGKAITQDGLAENETSVSFASPGGDAACKLEVRPAFAYPDAEARVKFEITIDYLYASPVSLSVKRGDAASTVLYPGIPTEISYSAATLAPAGPDGTKRLGFVRAIEKKTRHASAEVEVIEE